MFVLTTYTITAITAREVAEVSSRGKKTGLKGTKLGLGCGGNELVARMVSMLASNVTTNAKVVIGALNTADKLLFRKNCVEL